MSQAVAILRYLAAQPVPSGVATIARALSISPSSCFNILKVLCAESFVNFDEMKKTYMLGSGVIALAHHALDPGSAADVARDVLAELADEFEATCTFWRLISDERILLIALEASDRAPTLRIRIGQRRPTMLGANGRTIMAALSTPRQDLQTKFKELRWEEPITFEEYMRQLEAARKAGWALDAGVLMRGMTSIASAVVDRGGEPRFTVAVTLLGGPHEKAFLKQIGEATSAAAERLRLKLFGDINALPANRLS